MRSCRMMGSCVMTWLTRIFKVNYPLSFCKWYSGHNSLLLQVRLEIAYFVLCRNVILILVLVESKVSTFIISLIDLLPVLVYENVWILNLVLL